jgi:glucosyl-3-phosphoglycerate phosphatase
LRRFSPDRQAAERSLKPSIHPRLFILRHGQTEWNRLGRLQGRLDSGLTARGRDQAARQGAILRALNLPPETTFWTSPQGRARATAAVALAGLVAEPRQDARLCEVSVGECEGLTHPEIRARFPGLIDPDKPFAWHFDCPGGEGMAALQTRVAAFLEMLAGPAVIVTHGITSRFLRARLLGCDWRGLGSDDGGQGVVYEIRDNMQFRHDDEGP